MLILPATIILLCQLCKICFNAQTLLLEWRLQGMNGISLAVQLLFAFWRTTLFVISRFKYLSALLATWSSRWPSPLFHTTIRTIESFHSLEFNFTIQTLTTCFKFQRSIRKSWTPNATINMQRTFRFFELSSTEFAIFNRHRVPWMCRSTVLHLILWPSVSLCVRMRTLERISSSRVCRSAWWSTIRRPSIAHGCLVGWSIVRLRRRTHARTCGLRHTRRNRTGIAGLGTSRAWTCICICVGCGP